MKQKQITDVKTKAQCEVDRLTTEMESAEQKLNKMEIDYAKLAKENRRLQQLVTDLQEEPSDIIDEAYYIQQLNQKETMVQQAHIKIDQVQTLLNNKAAESEQTKVQLTSAANIINLTEKERDLLKNENKQLQKQLKETKRKADRSAQLEN